MTSTPPIPALREPPDGIAHREGAQMQWLETPDGVKLRVALWPASVVDAQGTVFVLQGRSEFIEKYREVIHELGARGFATVAFDWRGQGGSDRQLRNPAKGHVEDFADYCLDLDTVVAEMKARNLPRPWSLMAHSMGGSIALMALGRGNSPFERAVLSSPLVAIAGWGGSNLARIVARVLASIGLSQMFIPGGSELSRTTGPFQDNPFTRDEARFATMKNWLLAHPDLGIGDPTIGWVSAAFNGLDTLQREDFGSENRTPVLILAAGADTVVSSRASQALAQRMRGASAIELAGARHEILMETDSTRALFWRAFDAFVAKAKTETANP
ncbi:MAG: alpha/beta fold hydrolase [Rhabdaerophilum sp.]